MAHVSSPAAQTAIRVRPYMPDDAAFVLQLAPRLLVGIPPWRDPERWLATAHDWLTGSIARFGKETMIFIAEDSQGTRLGAAAVSHHQHFTGEQQAYIGELAVSEVAEGHGAGQALVEACAGWAREQGYRFLALETGIANTRARGFYAHLGFLEEDIRLVKPL
ncbi:MAG TPA: GNAT family N-acetyltransferase [Ktedonobacterales bacterium]|nr:GNAT family N-acetyltransferase [Ktedonobacterales bacterium]